MFEKEIRFIYDFYLNKIKSLGSYFTYTQLLTSELHPAILQYITAEIEFLLFEDRQKLLKNSVFDYNSDRIVHYFSLIGDEIKKNKRFSMNYVSKLILHAVSFNINYLVRPKWSLIKFVFDDSTHKTTTEIKQILNYVYFYDHIKSVLVAYLNKKKILSINESELKDLLDKIDKYGIESYLPVIIDTALISMGDFFNSGSLHKTKVPVQAVKLFLEDKNLNSHLEKIQSVFPDDEKLNAEIRDLKSILGSVDFEITETLDATPDREAFVEIPSVEDKVHEVVKPMRQTREIIDEQMREEFDSSEKTETGKQAAENIDAEFENGIPAVEPASPVKEQFEFDDWLESFEHMDGTDPVSETTESVAAVTDKNAQDVTGITETVDAEVQSLTPESPPEPVESVELIPDEELIDEQSFIEEPANAEAINIDSISDESLETEVVFNLAGPDSGVEKEKIDDGNKTSVFDESGDFIIETDKIEYETLGGDEDKLERELNFEELVAENLPDAGSGKIINKSEEPETAAEELTGLMEIGEKNIREPEEIFEENKSDAVTESENDLSAEFEKTLSDQIEIDEKAEEEFVDDLFDQRKDKPAEERIKNLDFRTESAVPENEEMMTDEIEQPLEGIINLAEDKIDDAGLTLEELERQLSSIDELPDADEIHELNLSEPHRDELLEEKEVEHEEVIEEEIKELNVERETESEMTELQEMNKEIEKEEIILNEPLRSEVEKKPEISAPETETAGEIEEYDIIEEEVIEGEDFVEYSLDKLLENDPDGRLLSNIEKELLKPSDILQPLKVQKKIQYYKVPRKKKEQAPPNDEPVKPGEMKTVSEVSRGDETVTIRNEKKTEPVVNSTPDILNEEPFKKEEPELFKFPKSDAGSIQESELNDVIPDKLFGEFDSKEKSEREEQQHPDIDVSQLLEHKHMTKIIEVIFDYDMEDFSNVIDKISECKSKEQASIVLEEYYSSNRITSNSREAELFKQIISEYFDQNG